MCTAPAPVAASTSSWGTKGMNEMKHLGGLGEEEVRQPARSLASARQDHVSSCKAHTWWCGMRVWCDQALERCVCSPCLGV